LCHPLERVAVAQEAFEFRDIFAFQFDRFRFAAAHGIAPQGADTLRYHQSDWPTTNSLQHLCNGPLAAKENNLPAIGTDVDQYNTDPEAKDALLSSAQKNVDVAVYNYLKTVAVGSVKAGISTATLQNGGVGLAPFHDWDSKIPADLKAQIQKASDGIKDGSIKIELPSAK
jgi:basic membrane protein A